MNEKQSLSEIISEALNCSIRSASATLGIAPNTLRNWLRNDPVRFYAAIIGLKAMDLQKNGDLRDNTLQSLCEKAPTPKIDQFLSSHEVRFKK